MREPLLRYGDGSGHSGTTAPSPTAASAHKQRIPGSSHSEMESPATTAGDASTSRGLHDVPSELRHSTVSTPDVRRTRPSSSLAASRKASLVDLSGDHFSYGDIQGSFSGLPEHNYLNRGRGIYALAREQLHLPALVETGRYAGRSRVQYKGTGIDYHLVTRDFFITMLQMPFGTMCAVMAAIYLLLYFFWGTIWYLLIRFYPTCVYGTTSYVGSWTLAIVTQMTIGYGNAGPQKCWAAAAIITAQAITCTVILNAVVLGLIFSKVASPAHRAYSIYISDTAVVTRRDGILKLLFRVADVRRTQVIEPRVRAYLYTWGEGRVTAEGEHIPVRCELLDLAYIDGMLLLPLIIEHTIDERSPLCGHTHDSLAAMNAEIVVTFEATTETGNPFLARQSYLAQEIHWGCTFQEIIQKPKWGEQHAPRYCIDLDSFHDVRCPELEDVGEDEDPRAHASRGTVNRAKRCVPYPLLGENTLVLSDLLCVRPVEGDAGGSRMELVCRVADTYPNQMLDVTARMYLYRWHPLEWCHQHPNSPPFTLHQLECGYSDGSDRLYLRLPQEVVHTIDGSSPLAGWLEPGGLSADADSEIVVVLHGYLYQTGTNRMRQRTYRVGSHVRYGFRFAPAVRSPRECRDGKPRVRWAHFFDVEPVGWSEGARGKPTIHMHTGALKSPALRAYLQRRTTQAAPESHAQVRAQQDRNTLLNQALDRHVPRSPRWVRSEPEAAAAAAFARRVSNLGPAAAAAAASAAAGGAAEGAPSAPTAHAPAQQLAESQPELQAAATALGAEEEAASVDLVARYQSSLSRLSALPPGIAAEAVEQHRQQQELWHQLPVAAAAEVGPESQQGSGPLGPPDLGEVSVEPSGSLDRYASALTRPSMDQPATSAGSAGGSPAPPWAGAPFSIPHRQAQQQEPHGSVQEQQQQQELPLGGSPAAGYAPQPDLLQSDLTATPSVPLERYAAMVASEQEEEAGGRQSAGSAGSGSWQHSEQSSSTALPPPPQRPGFPAGRPPRPAGQHLPAVQVPDRQLQQEPSWHKRRSLANLTAILEQEREQEEDKEQSLGASGSEPGSA